MTLSIIGSIVDLVPTSLETWLRNLVMIAVYQDHSLVGAGGDQLDLLVGQRVDRVEYEIDDPDRFAVAQQWNAQDSSEAARPLAFEISVLWIGQNVVQMKDTAQKCSPANERSRRRADRISAKECFYIGRKSEI